MGKTGPELMIAMQDQAVKFGAQLVYETVVKINKIESGFEIETNAGTKESYEAVILAMGASPKLLGIGEDKYWGKGFSTCAVCDAAFYKNKKVYVVGGGEVRRPRCGDGWQRAVARAVLAAPGVGAGVASPQECALSESRLPAEVG